jgi:HAD superfamily hydrolase (TIGR01549 family)
MAIKAVLFDLDHTLVDTKKEYIFSTVNNALSYFGKKATLQECVYFWLNNDREKILKEKKVDIYDFWEKFHEIDNPLIRAKNTYAYPDALSFIKQLKGKYKTGIITNAPLRVAKEEIKCINHEFDILLSANKNPKPNPLKIFECCEYLGISSKEAIYIGDDKSDMEAANNSGMNGILIYRGLKKPFNHLPTITSLEDAMQIIEK